jgi:hypothetical protein
MKTIHTSLLQAWTTHARPSTQSMMEAVSLLENESLLAEKLMFISSEFMLLITNTITQNSAEAYNYFKVLLGWSLNLDGKFALELITNGANSLRYLLIAEDRLAVEIIYNLLSSCIIAIFTKPNFQSIIEDLDSQKPSTSRLRMAETEISRLMVLGTNGLLLNHFVVQ